ncbi:MAG: penicillin-binding protein 2 [Candidatus Omnitrophica bacterium]|nr:penicillin-binding protein 2 [Candidatus Omnitrophota bacterium]
MSRRIAQLQSLLLIAFAILTLRLLDLQILQGTSYRRLAEQNRIRLVPEQAPRGLVVDRQGRVLADDETVFRVAVVPQELEDLPSVLTHLSALIHRPVADLKREFTRQRSLAFLPATVVDRVPKELALRLEEDRWQFPGLFIKAEAMRRYPLGASASHVLGYLGQPTPEELPLLKPYGVRPTHLVGRMGLERLLDHALRGQSGGVMVEVDHQARRVRMLGSKTPQPGARVTLTIDGPLQSLIETALGTQPGACVVVDPATGDVLAMVSVPAFPPSAFIASDTQLVRQLFNNPQSPIMNRATMGVYQPGSIIKLVTAAAALEARAITPSTTFVCPGALTIGDRTFHCWNRDGHGPLALRDALKQSCNVYFMQVSRRLGADRLRAALEQVGFSHRTAWPMEQAAGHLPSRRLTEGEVALLGIGQGEILVTVLQCALMASVFANRGWLIEPRIVTSVAAHAWQGQTVRRRLAWSVETIDAVRVGMQAVVSDPDGTGHRALSPLVSIGGKTGTAQTHIPGQTHGWFVGFCPIEHPRVAMAIVVEHGGSGGDLPAEVAKAICEYAAVPGAL